MIPALTEKEVERFYSRIQRGSGCWPWTSEKHTFGYGRFVIYRGGVRVRILAHRLSYKLFTGEDPGDRVVRHDCDNPVCNNPAHLRLGTQADNIHDAITRGRLDTKGLAAYRADRDRTALERLETNEKQCSRCKTVKTLADFFRNRREIDGRARWCKACSIQRQRENRKSERDRRAATTPPLEVSA